jgi:signal transduction histidine kinase
MAVHAVRLTADLQRSREQLVMAREAERRRLRRDLHDGLGQALASQALQLDAVYNLLRHDPVEARMLVTDLKTQTQNIIADIRRLVYELRPPALDELGLVPALREQAEQINQLDGLRISLEAPDYLPPLPAAVEVAAYRITLEALTNVVRHAHARQCAIRLALDNVLRLEIIDDGCGLPAHRRTGIGLTSIRERTTELGGTCIIQPAPAGGTQVLVSLPLPKEKGERAWIASAS